MIVRISELMENYRDGTYDLPDPGLADRTRIRARTAERIDALRRAESAAVCAKKSRRTLRIVLLAAALTALLSVTAYAVYQRIVIVERQTQATDTETGQTESLTEVGFEPTSDEPVLLGVWEMGAVPNGFAMTESFYSAGYATVSWERDGGGRLDLTYTKGGNVPGSMTLPSGVEMKKEDVTVHDSRGTLYTLGEEDDYRVLLWTDEARGVGFSLVAQDGADDVDLIPLAESVVLTDHKPETDQQTLDAIARLGDWAPTDLPEGYEPYFSQGSGGALYDSPYAYVRRFYTNAAGYAIELRCETPVNETYAGYVDNYRSGFERPADQPNAICTVTDTTVQGQPAGLIEYPDGTPLRLVWLTEDGTVAFLLSADDLTSEELLALAESVACLAPPTAPSVPADTEVPPAVKDANGVIVTPQPTEKP